MGTDAELRTDRGSASLGWVGALLVVAVLVTTLLTGADALGARAGTRVSQVVCQVTGAEGPCRC